MSDSGNSDSTSLTVISSSFQMCNTTSDIEDQDGGGAIYVDWGTLSVASSEFIHCSTKSYGGGIYAQHNCISSSATLCTFISCSGNDGGGFMTYLGPSSSLYSCRFISCTAEFGGGAVFHDKKNQYCFILLSDSFFTDNFVDSDDVLGGGAVEDYRAYPYSSNYSFLFFTRNAVPNGVGNDISINGSELDINNIHHCFTTTTFHSFWNTKYTGYDDWLPQTNRNLEHLAIAIIYSAATIYKSITFIREYSVP